MPGRLIISLDFELHWGVRDHSTVAQYAENLLGVRRAIPAMLAEFQRRGVHATWATVGFLLFRTRRELLAALPRELPTYADSALDPYRALANIGEDEDADPFHFGESLVRAIVATPGQELATHTFSHFYCMEPGQTKAQFSADIGAAVRAAQRFGVVPRSLVFPRNQANLGYLDILAAHGITAYRGNPSLFAYRAVAGGEERLRRRAVRLVDAYIPLDRLAGSTRATSPRGLPADAPGTIFLRPVPRGRMRYLERARLARIAGAMRRAARDGGDVHLWWHPHNFGVNLRENMAFLAQVLDEFEALRRRLDMHSVSMAESVD